MILSGNFTLSASLFSSCPFFLVFSNSSMIACLSSSSLFLIIEAISFDYFDAISSTSLILSFVVLCSFASQLLRVVLPDIGGPMIEILMLCNPLQTEKSSRIFGREDEQIPFLDVQLKGEFYSNKRDGRMRKLMLRKSLQSS